MRAADLAPVLRHAAFAVVLVMGTVGCTHRYGVSARSSTTALREVNHETAGEDAWMLAASGEILRWRDVRFRSDSISGLVPGGARSSLATEDVIRVTVRSRSRGAWEGMRLGIPVGALVGAIAGPERLNSDYLDHGTPQAALIGALGGALYGTIIGAIRASRTEVEILVPRDDRTMMGEPGPGPR